MELLASRTTGPTGLEPAHVRLFQPNVNVGGGETEEQPVRPPTSSNDTVLPLEIANSDASVATANKVCEFFIRGKQGSSGSWTNETDRCTIF